MFGYTGDRLTTIIDTLGRTISIGYVAAGPNAGLIQTVTDFTSREVRYEYYETDRLPSVQKGRFEGLTPKKSGVHPVFTDEIVPDKRDRFALRLRAWISLPADGEYTFFTSSDDGSRLWVGDRQVVDNDGNHGDRERSGKIRLTAGKHQLLVTYQDTGGGDALRVSYAGPGIAKREVPASALAPALSSMASHSEMSWRYGIPAS